jgi:hypothetical protein
MDCALQPRHVDVGADSVGGRESPALDLQHGANRGQIMLVFGGKRTVLLEQVLRLGDRMHRIVSPFPHCRPKGRCRWQPLPRP